MARPIFFATAIIITTYLPLFAFQRIEAKLFYPMAYAVGFAQFGALVFALAGGPGPRLPGLSQAAAHLSQPRARLARARYRRRPERSLRRPSIVYLAMRRRRGRAWSLGVTVWREFLPELDEGSIWLHAEIAARHLAAEGDRDGRRAAPVAAANSPRCRMW